MSANIKLVQNDNGTGYNVTLTDQDGNLRAQVLGVSADLPSGRMVEVAEEYTRRIAACVNACHGIDIQTLERAISIGGVTIVTQPAFDEIARRARQRDELLEALVIAVGSIEEICMERGVPLPNSTLSRSRAAIAKAKGGAA